MKLPIRLVLAKNKATGKKYYLNLNEYRNAHYRCLASMKLEFGRMVEGDVFKRIKKLSEIRDRGRLILTYTVFPFQKVDAANVACIVDKFFCDILQGCGVIENDDHSHIAMVTYKFGSVCRDDPHCLVEIVAEQ